MTDSAYGREEGGREGRGEEGPYLQGSSLPLSIKANAVTVTSQERTLERIGLKSQPRANRTYRPTIQEQTPEVAQVSHRKAFLNELSYRPPNSPLSCSSQPGDSSRTSEAQIDKDFFYSFRFYSKSFVSCVFRTIFGS